MKKLVLASALLLSSISQAEVRCFVATNPEQIKISTEDNKKIEQAIAANAKLDQEIVELQDGSIKPADLELMVESKTMIYKTDAIAFDKKQLDVYGVECDGGQVNVNLQNGQLTLSTDEYGLKGEIRHKFSFDGCHTGTVVFEKLVLEEVACK